MTSEHFSSAFSHEGDEKILSGNYKNPELFFKSPQKPFMCHKRELFDERDLCCEIFSDDSEMICWCKAFEIASRASRGVLQSVTLFSKLPQKQLARK
jgi:hypothetical protein